MLHAAVEAADEVIVVTDEAGYVQYANPAFEHVTGYRRDEILGGDLHLLDGGTHNGSFFAEMRRVLRSEGRWSGRLTSRRKDGTMFREECTVSPVRSADGDVTGFVHVRRDVTEKLRLQAVQEAVSTTADLGVIFSSIRHELGNPINAALMTLRLLEERGEDVDGGSAAEYLDRAIDALCRASYLLHTLKSYDAYENVSVTSVDVRELLESWVHLATRDFAELEVPVSLTIDDDIGEVSADPKVLRHVLNHVLANALHASGSSGVTGIWIRATRFAGEVTILVDDDGNGGSPESTGAAPRPFASVGAAGIGLGLAVARRAMSRMGGAIAVTNRPGMGTWVELRLPRPR